MTISALDKETVKLITTTQIITSVSTVAKELIENALDANAKNLEINLTDNGCSLIEVKDDGCGISKIDAPYMALPSYTSKLLNFSDLDSLDTYGFRGEALYALSSLSDLTIITKTKQDEAATSYTIDHHGCITKSMSCHRAATGTTVQVKQLFKPIPVRRQIITNKKKATQDIKAIESLAKSYGMCKFLVRISFKVDGNIIFVKPSTATLEEAVTYILGKKVTSNMTWIDIENAELSMKLMVPSKEAQNVSEVFHIGSQYIFVNNRPLKHKELEKVVTNTVLEALVQDSSARKKPIFLLYVLINSINVDVNLEPNKTSILFKDQQMVLDTVDRRLKEFYGLQGEVQVESTCEQSLSDYQDYTQTINNNDTINEWPVCKRRKIEVHGSIEKFIERNARASEKSNDDIVQNLNPESSGVLESNEQVQNAKNGQYHSIEDDSKREKFPTDSTIPTSSLNLSDTDSNDSQNFTLVYDNNNVSGDLIDQNKMETTDDSPPFELTPLSETLSQLPVVDLGEEFDLENCLSKMNTDVGEKENQTPNAVVQRSRPKNKLNSKKGISLDEWSKGHVFGLKGGTDVQPYTDTESLKEKSYQGNTCKGFLKFSKHIKSQVTGNNPGMTAPQIANAITKFWKKLSSEERGYYRDLARDEEIECSTEKRNKEDQSVINVKTNKNRLMNVLEKLETMGVEKKENLVMRTTVPWEIDIKKVTGSFINNSTCKNSNFVLGLLHSNSWVVHVSSHIWILDASSLKKKLNISDTSMHKETVESMEELLNQYFSMDDNLSILHPIHKLTENKNAV